jgi:Flp pilus assembly protein CpaB
VLPKGRRAYTLPSKVNPMGALLRADDEVDVLLLRAGKTEVLLENIRVLGVGRVLRGGKNAGDEDSYSARDDVTLDVSLAQAQELMTAEETGELRLVLRNPEDEGLQGPKAPQQKSTRRSLAHVEKKEIEHVR